MIGELKSLLKKVLEPRKATKVTILFFLQAHVRVLGTRLLIEMWQCSVQEGRYELSKDIADSSLSLYTYP